MRTTPVWRWIAVAMTMTIALSGGLYLDSRPASASAGELRWAPPELTDPIELTVTSATPLLKLDDGRDYRLHIADGFEARGGLSVVGGRNVVLIGGTIEVPTEDRAPGVLDRRGLYLKQQQGTVHVEGLRIVGSDLAEGINIDQRSNNVVQLQNVRIDTVRRGTTGYNASVMRVWAGPKTLRIDRLEAATEYQGLFLLPRQQFGAAVVEDWQLSNIRIRSAVGTGRALWKDNGHVVGIDNVSIGRDNGSTSQLMHPGVNSWPGVKLDAQTAPSPIVGDPGTDYVSPGYSGVVVAAPTTTTTTKAPTTTTSTTAPARPIPVAAGSGLRWRPPVLVDPVTVQVSRRNQNLKLDVSRDYRLEIIEPLTARGGLRVMGGRNVVLIGGSVMVPSAVEAPDAMDRRGLYLKGQTGTVHIEGVHFGGELTDAVNLDERLGATVQLQNIVVDMVHGSSSGFHADVVQAWAGPRTLHIDRLEASTQYQGLFLTPNQQFSAAVTEDWSLRNVRVRSVSQTGIPFWKQSGLKVASENVSTGRAVPSKTPLTSPSLANWPGVTLDAMSGAVVTSGSPGMGYRSPGYDG